MKTILVTGAAGFIGFHTTKKLLDKGYKVVGLDNMNDYYDKSLKYNRIKILLNHKNKKNFCFYKEDINNLCSLGLINGKHKLDQVIHLASQEGVKYSLGAPFVYVENNLKGFVSILEFVRKNKLPLIYASSSSVYGDSKLDKFTEEDNTDTPISLYATTKKANELLAYTYSSLFKIPAIGLRLFTVYGPMDRSNTAVFKFTQNILEGTKIDVYNNGEMYRDFTYIDDVANGILSCLNLNFSKNKIPYEIINLGCGNPRKLIDFVKLIEKYCSKKAKINFMPPQPGDVLKTSANTAKAKKLIGFKPKVKLEDGLKKFIEWYKKYYLKQTS